MERSKLEIGQRVELVDGRFGIVDTIWLDCVEVYCCGTYVVCSFDQIWS